MSQTADISSRFLAARRAAKSLSSFPGTVPETLQAAYAVQAKSIADWGESIAGYKVGGIGPEWRDQYPGTRIAGPVFSSLIFTIENGGRIDIPVFENGFAAYEPELIMRLEGFSDVRKEIESVEDAKRFVKNIHIGVEIASSPLASLNDLGPGSIISDFGNQAGVVIGPEIDLSWLDRIHTMDVTTRIDGEIVGQTTPNEGDNGPLGALRFLINHLIEHAPKSGLPDSLWLSSGAITGVHKSQIGTVGAFDYGPLGKFEIAMVKHQPIEGQAVS